VFGSLTYLIWLALFIGLPLLLIIWLWPQRLWRQRHGLALTGLGSLVGGWAWDALAVKWGVWYFDPANMVNLWFLGLPLEEWLWFTGVSLMFGALTVVLVGEQTEAGYQ
jgi:lycopene cyclase domain-containing protein